jgi:cold shock CspA family protein
MSFQEKITEWNDDRGFGFIESDDGGKRVFVHIKSFERRSKRPLVNDVVTYRVKTDERGKVASE